MKVATLPKVLVVDDEIGTQESLKMILQEDYFVFTAPSGEEAFRLLDQETPDVVLLDVFLPGMDGIEILKKVKSLKPLTQVVMVTGQDKVKTAVEAMKLGAYDYVHKPFDVDELRGIVKKALDDRKNREGFSQSSEEKVICHFDSIIGSSSKMQEVYESIIRVMVTTANVLITGESGTGKELVARAIHYNGNRKEGSFVVVNTSAIPDKLLESELFGHEKGAFTGAIQRKEGMLEIAHGGTLFLDEIGDMPVELQSKLLRVIQEREFRRVGGTESIHVDVRFIAATNKNLEKAVQAGTFRDDLYYRLNVVPIVLPPLRDRKEDIASLVYHFLERNRSSSNSMVESFSREAIESLQSYTWPGNVRELQNVIEHLAVMIDHPLIQIEDLPQQVRMNQLQGNLLSRYSKKGTSLEDLVGAFERELIEEALKKCNGIFSRAARLLGTTRRILKYRIDQLHIQSQRKRKNLS